jgi:hypothetical protein
MSMTKRILILDCLESPIFCKDVKVVLAWIYRNVWVRIRWRQNTAGRCCDLDCRQLQVQRSAGEGLRRVLANEAHRLCYRLSAGL